jgi:hypothetical protein
MEEMDWEEEAIYDVEEKYVDFKITYERELAKKEKAMEQILKSIKEN